MSIIRSCFIGFLALMSVAAMPSPAGATWLGLADGTYDVTLSCVTSPVIPCPSTIDGTMTIAGAGATAFDFTVNGQIFDGVPTNGTDSSMFGTDEHSGLGLSPFSFLLLQDFSTGGFPGLTPQSWSYCNNIGDPSSCSLLTNGNWTVPEPPGMALFVLGLGIIALAGVTRRRGAVRVRPIRG